MNQRTHRKPDKWPALMSAAVAAIVLAALGGLYLTLRPAGTPADASEAISIPYQWPHQEVPIGITLSGLQNYVIAKKTVVLMEHQISAAKHFWYANTIRLQIEQDKLVGVKGTDFNQPYMREIRVIVAYTLRQGLTVVLNAQTEVTIGYNVNEHLPTHATAVFWQRMMDYYANNKHVVFDLFNEPRFCHWKPWHRTMQHLVNLVRRKADNTIWAEGLWWGSTFSGIIPLHGQGIVYSFHKPGSPWPWRSVVSRKMWDHAFGDFCNAGHACVDGEFGNYKGSYYWLHHPFRHVVKYLAYLTAHHIGMLAWSLIPGALNKDESFDSVSREPEGDGNLVRKWFAARSQAVVRF